MTGTTAIARVVIIFFASMMISVIGQAINRSTKKQQQREEAEQVNKQTLWRVWQL